MPYATHHKFGGRIHESATTHAVDEEFCDGEEVYGDGRRYVIIVSKGAASGRYPIITRIDTWHEEAPHPYDEYFLAEDGLPSVTCKTWQRHPNPRYHASRRQTTHNTSH